MPTPWTRRSPQITERVTANLPQTADGALFRITGGKIIVHAIVGEVTTAIQAQADNTKLKFNPSGTGADTDLCAVLDITGGAVGTLYGISGDFSDAMKASGGVWAMETDLSMEAPKVILGPGDIELDCAASNTGKIKWTLLWSPLDAGATVAAV